MAPKYLHLLVQGSENYLGDLEKSLYMCSFGGSGGRGAVREEGEGVKERRNFR